MELLKYKILLEKYFEGNTSLDEEKDLNTFLEYYEGDDVELLEAKTLFTFHADDKAMEMDLSFDEFLNVADKSKAKPLKLRQLYVASSAIAASIVLVISLLATFNNNDEPIVYAYVNGQAITNKAEAIQYSQKALNTMSINLNKGTQNLSYMKQLNRPAALITAQ